jgi:hypothetical protein
MSRRASEYDRIDYGALRGSSRIGPLHPRAHWPDSAGRQRARTPRLALEVME